MVKIAMLLKGFSQAQVRAAQSLFCVSHEARLGDTVCTVCVCVGYLQWLPPTSNHMLIRLTGQPKWIFGV